MGSPARFPRIKALADVAALRRHLAALAIDLPVDDALLTAAAGSPLARPLPIGGPNRFVVQPMEGWDAELDGRPSPLVRRRWARFGASGAGWVWGCEAVAVRADGRANPRQLLLSDATASELGALRADLVARARAVGVEPLVGLQLTHSGRFARPVARVAFREPALDALASVTDDAAVLDDDEVDAIVASFGDAARLAREEGFDFVDLKHCHGYLLHEFLGARDRGGRFGGPGLEARLRVLEAVVATVRDAAPGLGLGVRLSLFDVAPCGRFGVEDLSEPLELVRRLPGLGVSMLNVTGASPYYAPHAQRPAAFPASDAEPPPEDPLVGVARLLYAARQAKRAAPELTVVSSGWSYLQEYVPHVAQACVRDGWFDAAPRHGLVSGCYPIDPYYRDRPERTELLRVKRAARALRRERS